MKNHKFSIKSVIVVHLNLSYCSPWKKNKKNHCINYKYLEKEMATHSRILAWRLPWTGKPGGHNLTTNPFGIIF